MVQVHVIFGDNSDQEWKWHGYVAVHDKEAEVLLRSNVYSDDEYDRAWVRLCNACERQVYGLRLDWFIKEVLKAE